MNITILTGFLGSGKTTLLRDYLTLPETAGTAIIVNEAGEIGLDGAIIAEGKGGLQLAMLANGCVCCAQGGELAATIESLLASVETPPARIVLETSGLSRPSPILRTLATLAFLRPRISVVATYDVSRGPQTAGFDEAAAQWAGAQAIALTRRDLATPAEIHAARDAARGINPLADLLDAPDRTTLLRQIFTPRPAAPPAPPRDLGTAHPRIGVLLLRPTAPLAWDDLAAWLDNLAGLLGDRLLRLKGALPIAGAEHAVLIQSVGTMFSAPRPFAAPLPSPFLVVIGQNLTPSDLATLTPKIPFEITRPTTPFSRPKPAKLRADAER